MVECVEEGNVMPQTGNARIFLREPVLTSEQENKTQN